MKFAFPCMLAFVAANVVEAQWTKRKGRSNKIIDKEEVETEVDPSTFGNFAAMNEAASLQETKPKRSSRRSRAANNAAPGMEELMNQMAGGGMAELMKGMAGSGGADMGELMKSLGNLGGGDMDLGSMMQQGMGMWKEMLDSPDMQEMLNNPDQMREMMLPFVNMMGGDVGKLDEVLADPAMLKESMTTGLETMTELFSDPKQMEKMASQMLKGLDPQTRDTVERLASGDEGVLTEMLAGIDPDGSLKDMMADLSDPSKLADPTFLAEMQKKLLDNSNLAGFAEKFVAENPEMAQELESVGINLGDLTTGGEASLSA